MQGSKRFSRIAWVAIPASSSFGFLRPSSKVWQFSPRFYLFILSIPFGLRDYVITIMKRIIILLLYCVNFIMAYCAAGTPVYGTEIDGIEYEFYGVYYYYGTGTPFAGEFGCFANVYKVKSNNSFCSIPSSINFKGLEVPVVTINDEAFKYSPKITHVEIADGISTIEINALQGSSVKYINIPPSIRNLSSDKQTFLTSYAIDSLRIDDSAASLIIDVFKNSTTPVISPKYVYVGRKINKAITNYGLFRDLGNFEEIVIGDLVSDVDAFDFTINGSYMISLRKLTLGMSLLKIPQMGISSLQELILTSPIPQDAEGFSAYNYVNTTLIIPKGSLKKYRDHPIWSNFINITENESAGLFEITNTTYSIKVCQNTLYINNLEPNTRVEIYNANGVLLANTYNNCFTLGKGIYFVKINNAVHKVVV